MIVKENIDNFTRGGDPYKKLKVGTHRSLDFKVGEKVYIKPNALQIYARRFGESTGYTSFQRMWRDSITRMGQDASYEILQVYTGSVLLRRSIPLLPLEVDRFMLSYLKGDDSMPVNENI